MREASRRAGGMPPAPLAAPATTPIAAVSSIRASPARPANPTPPSDARDGPCVLNSSGAYAPTSIMPASPATSTPHSNVQAPLVSRLVSHLPPPLGLSTSADHIVTAAESCQGSPPTVMPAPRQSASTSSGPVAALVLDSSAVRTPVASAAGRSGTATGSSASSCGNATSPLAVAASVSGLSTPRVTCNPPADGDLSRADDDDRSTASPPDAGEEVRAGDCRRPPSVRGFVVVSPWEDCDTPVADADSSALSALAASSHRLQRDSSRPFSSIVGSQAWADSGQLASMHAPAANHGSPLATTGTGEVAEKVDRGRAAGRAQLRDSLRQTRRCRLGGIRKWLQASCFCVPSAGVQE